MKTIYESIYKNLVQLIPHLFELKLGDAQKSRVSGYMDLNLDILQKESDFTVVALSHYYKMNGDMIADPDMEIKVYPYQMAEALTFQDIFGYQAVYPEENKINVRAKKTLNEFLNQWLKNCIMQGHKFIKE